jgi:4'-phosphopantetheinyl transferase
MFPAHLVPLRSDNGVAGEALNATGCDPAEARVEVWWAGADAARDYTDASLRPEDTLRAALPRSARAMQEWRVSRAALAHALAIRGPSAAWSLSHSHECALVAAAPPQWRLGVDLERMRARDVDNIAQWVCSTDEIAALSACAAAAQLQTFYLLWTLKESLVKAAGLDFPADMRAVGLDPGSAGWMLRVPGNAAWHARSAMLGTEWMAAVAWSAESADAAGQADAAELACEVEPVWRSGPRSVLPEAMAAWQWMSKVQG